MTDIGDPLMSVPARLGASARYEDGTLFIDVEPGPHVLHHGCVRASVLAYAIDVAAGLVVDSDPDAWAFTSDLSVRTRPVPAAGTLSAVATVLRRGRRSATSTVDVRDAQGAVAALGAIGFATVPRREGDPPKPHLTPEQAPEVLAVTERLGAPLREEAGIEVVDAASGTLRLEVVPAICNPAGTVQGAMVALLAEAAVEDLVSAAIGGPSFVTDLDVRYLGKATEGFVTTRCTVLGEPPDASVRVELVSSATGAVTTSALARCVAVV